LCGKDGFTPTYQSINRDDPSRRSGNLCNPDSAMKILVGIFVILIVVASFYADYKWRQWITARRRDRP
jgi:hypothetical protein